MKHVLTIGCLLLSTPVFAFGPPTDPGVIIESTTGEKASYSNPSKPEDTARRVGPQFMMSSASQSSWTSFTWDRLLQNLLQFLLR